MTLTRRFPSSGPGSVCSKLDSMTSAPTFTLDRRTVLHLASDQSVSTLAIDEDSWTQR